jgi:NADH dehydrogenase
MKTKEKIIIIGGGFAGLHLARKLNNTNFEVLLIDRQNHHQFQPLFYQVATARLEPASISFPFRKIFQRSPNIQIRLTEVKRVVPQEKRIETGIGSFDYDKLVIATGCKTNFFGNTRMSELALSMKNTEEAIHIRNKVLLNFERIISAPDNEKEAYENIVIVGAGPTGVELAGAFAEMKNNILPKDYPNIDFSHMKILLVEGSNHTLNSMSNGAKAASQRYLTELGVSLELEVFVKDYDGTTVTFSNGATIRSKNVIWAAGVMGNVIEGLDEASVFKSRFIVDRQNKVKGYDAIYALGDVAYMETPLYPHGHPQLANVAINQAKNLGWNLLHQDKKPLDYEYKDLGSMATIGKDKAVVDLPYIQFQGRFAWFVWMFLHLMLILSVRNKLIIFINWAWSYVTKDSSLRLITHTEDK